ncbi:MAG: class I adenylate-forming enzyme family protein [Acidimicrobiia bacterium]
MILAGGPSREALQRAGDRVLLIGPDSRERTAAQVLGRVEGLAVALVRRGLAGQRVGVWYWNSPAAIEAHLALEWVGATRVPVDPSAPPAEAEAVWRAAGVEAALVDGAHRLDAPVEPLLHEDDEPLASPGTFEGLSVDPHAVAVLFPRMATKDELFAVPISYANWGAAMEVNVSLYRTGVYGPGFDDEECFVTAQQIMHGTGLLGTFPFIHMGLPQVLLGRFDAGEFLEAALRHRATATFFVPGMVTRLADAIVESGRAACPPLRRVLYGGAPIELSDLRRAVEVIGPVLVQLYGRYDGGWPLAVLGVEEHVAIASGDPSFGRSCGKPIPQIEIRLRALAGKHQGRGELSVRGPTVVREVADPDGWLAMGDVASLDDDGYLYLAGRLDGMINTGSFHVYPPEVEEAIASVDGVAEVLVRGEPDSRWGEAVTAYVVPAADASPKLVDLLGDACARRLARYKIPKRFELVPDLDRIRSG